MALFENALGPRRWRNEAGWRIAGSRPLDASKVQAPSVVRLPDGTFRLFYTAIGPGKPYPLCQGYILSAVSDDGLNFTVENGIRLATDPDIPWRSRRVLAPAVTVLSDGGWRMYFEARGQVALPTVIASATSRDLLTWEVEVGVRLQKSSDIGGPRFVRLPDGRSRIYCFSRADCSVVSAITTDGLTFEWEPGERLQGGQAELESSGITAADVIPPANPDDQWTMLYSAWQAVPPGTEVPPHPSTNAALADSPDIDFAAASIAADMAGYRSRIFTASSPDGLTWQRQSLALEGDGYGGNHVGAVHAEDMSVMHLGDGHYRMYYAACDARGIWRIASAISEG